MQKEWEVKTEYVSRGKQRSVRTKIMPNSHSTKNRTSLVIYNKIRIEYNWNYKFKSNILGFHVTS